MRLAIVVDHVKTLNAHDSCGLNAHDSLHNRMV